MRADDPNVAMLEAVVEHLGPLADDMVFIGGSTIGLLITDPAAPGVRATDDVDALVEVASRLDYHRVAAALRSRGFSEDDSPEPVLARWRIGSHVLDVMPTDTEILGFGNPWYPHTFNSAAWATLPRGHRVRHITAPLFLATKRSAFEGRGRGDYQASHDIEDFIAVVDGRAGIVDEIAEAGAELANYLAEGAAQWLDDPDFVQALPGLLPPDAGSQARLGSLREKLESIARRAR